jgi:Protein of unknown function (DUF3500)
MFDRRQFIATAGATAAIPFLDNPSHAAVFDLGDATAVRNRTVAFLSSLQPEQAVAARFPLDGDVQRNWNYFGIGGYIKPGFRLEQMNALQKERAWDMLATILSERGLQKARDVMSLQQVVMDNGDGATLRGPERFSLAIFGDPTAASRWAIRLEGHHLSLTYTIEKDRLVGVTPSSFSVNPNRVQSGRFAGLNTLKREDTFARRLAADLSSDVKRQVFFQERPFGNILASAGREKSLTKRVGAPVSSLVSAQRDLVLQITDSYTAEHLVAPFAAAVTSRLSAGMDTAHFAFAGSTTVGESAYYRLQGDRFLIEFATVDSAAQHLHTIFHLT